MSKVSSIIRLIVVLIVGVLIGGAIIVFGVKNAPGFFSAHTETTHSKVVKAVQAEEQVVLMSLGIEGITEQSKKAEVFGKQIPFTDRTKFIQYSYKAKLGVEGKDVKIDNVDLAEDSDGLTKYVITVPKFEFIGHSDEEFKTAVEDNGVLAWTTDDLDAASLVTDILNDDAQQKNVDDNREFLETQAESFYGSIVKSVDPQAEVEFKFEG